MEMRGYYCSRFRDDLAAFMGDARVPYFGHAWHHNCISQIARVPPEHRAPFLICLYFTVLVDQGMHTHYRSQYQRFEALTRYPKFCHGLSQSHHNPRAILATPVDQGAVGAEDVLEALPDGMTVFVDQVIDFFHDHMRDVDPAAFLDALLYDPDVQIPDFHVMLDRKLETDVVVVAYRELRAAVGRALDVGVG
jgi:hypothetical protein